MNLIESYFYGANDAKIFYRRDIPYHARAIMIIAHGYMEHSGRYIEFADSVVTTNIGVCILDHRGNGRSEGDKGDIEDFFLFVEDIACLVTHLKEKYNKPILTFGHSMGGLITFLYGLKYPDYVMGQIFSSPALGVPLGCKYLPQSLYEYIGHMPGVKFVRIGQELAVRNKEFLQQFKQDVDCNDYATGRFMDQFLRIGVHYALDHAAEYNIDSLFLLGEADHVIPIDRNQSILSKVQRANKQVIIYPKCMHDLLHELDDERKKITEDILAWLEQLLKNINK